MSQIIGCFYFKRTSNNNLIGEFTNNLSEIVSTESADLIFQSDNTSFIGRYDSSWQENGVSHFAKLDISYKNGSNKSVFSLKWRGNSKFDGEGMLCDNILIGNYWSVD